MVERIKQLIAEKKMTLASFARVTDIKPTTISHIINGRETEGKGKVNQMPSTDVITKILSTFPDLNAEWLIMGKGAMHKGRHTLIEPELFPDADAAAIKPSPLPATSEYRQENEEKEIKIPQKQMFPSEFSFSENIDKIVIFFKNKTYITLKPEE
jgi:transcriptional regulator with XRE-family HTH domain